MVKSAHTRKNSTFAIRKCATFSIRTIFIYNHTHTCYALISKKIDEKEEDILSTVNSVWCNGKNDIMWYLGVVFISSQYSLTHYFFLSSFFLVGADSKDRACWRFKSAYHCKSFRLYTTIFDIVLLLWWLFYDFHDFASDEFWFFSLSLPPFVGYYL